jgi:hypothetical protein
VSNRLLNRFVLKAAVGVGSLALELFAQVAAGQTNGVSPKYLPNRFLVVVETSRGMQRRSEAMVRAVQELLSSAIAAQAHRGDTLGVWTYNEDMSTGVLPLQQWSPETRDAISKRVVEFLQGQKFEKRANLEKVVSAIDRINKNSQFITVILVCLGDTNIQGTPFDSRINQFFQTWRVQQQDAGTPFVIALRGQAGVFVDCSMNPSPWPPELPALPRELLTPVKPALDVQVHRPATSSVPNLIVSGKKRDAVATNSTRQSVPSTGQSVEAAVTNPPSAAPRPGIASEASIVTTAPLTTGPAVGTSPLPSNPITGDKSPADAAPVTASTLTLPAVANPGESFTAQPSARATAPTLPPPAAAEKPIGQALPVQPEMAPQTKLGDAAAREHQTAATPVQTATAHVAAGRANYLVLGATAFVSVSALVGAVILWRGRRRNLSDTSLITESYDRRKE